MGIKQFSDKTNLTFAVIYLYTRSKKLV